MEGLLGPGYSMGRAISVLEATSPRTQVGLNQKLERLSTLVVQAGRTLLMSNLHLTVEYRNQAKRLGIEDVPRKLHAFKETLVEDEGKAFRENLKMLKQSHLFFKKASDAFLFLQYSQSVGRLSGSRVARLQRLSYHARLLLNQFIE